MLVLSREIGEAVVVGEGAAALVVRIVDIRGTNVRIGFEVDRSVPVHREEVAEAIAAGVSVQEFKAKHAETADSTTAESRRAA